jgi:hypothetical protein
LESWKKILPDDKIHEIFKIIEHRLNIISEESGGFKLTIPFVVIDSIKK